MPDFFKKIIKKDKSYTYESLKELYESKKTLQLLKNEHLNTVFSSELSDEKAFLNMVFNSEADSEAIFAYMAPLDGYSETLSRRDLIELSKTHGENGVISLDELSGITSSLDEVDVASGLNLKKSIDFLGKVKSPKERVLNKALKEKVQLIEELAKQGDPDAIFYKNAIDKLKLENGIDDFMDAVHLVKINNEDEADGTFAYYDEGDNNQISLNYGRYYGKVDEAGVVQSFLHELTHVGDNFDSEGEEKAAEFRAKNFISKLYPEKNFKTVSVEKIEQWYKNCSYDVPFASSGYGLPNNLNLAFVKGERPLDEAAYKKELADFEQDKKKTIFSLNTTFQINGSTYISYRTIEFKKDEITERVPTTMIERVEVESPGREPLSYNVYYVYDKESMSLKRIEEK